METNETDVNVESSTTEEVQPEVNNESVPSGQTTEKEQTQVESNLPLPDVDEFGVPWKNRAMEYKRKSEEVIEKLPQVVEEALTKHQPQQQQKELSVAELEAFAIAEPEHRPWVEAKKEELRENKFRNLISQTREEERQKFQQEHIRQESTRAVLSDPRYAEAFVTNNQGVKVWNPNSTLAQGMGRYMQDARLQNQPDAILIAARLARADMLDNSTPEQLQKLTSLKRENAKLKQKTQVEGSGNNVTPKTVDPYQEAKAKAAKTGSQKDVQDAVKLYLKKQGLI